MGWLIGCKHYEMFEVISFIHVRVKQVDDMHEQDRMTTQENCKLDVQHKDITQYGKFIQNKSFKGVRVHNQTQANNNLLMVPYDHA